MSNVTEENSLKVIQLDVKSNTECFKSLNRVLGESQYCAASEAGQLVTCSRVCIRGKGPIFPDSISRQDVPSCLQRRLRQRDGVSIERP